MGRIKFILIDFKGEKKGKKQKGNKAVHVWLHRPLKVCSVSASFAVAILRFNDLGEGGGGGGSSYKALELGTMSK
jgi:hypothetical protein